MLTPIFLKVLHTSVTTVCQVEKSIRGPYTQLLGEKICRGFSIEKKKQVAAPRESGKFSGEFQRPGAFGAWLGNAARQARLTSCVTLLTRLFIMQ